MKHEQNNLISLRIQPKLILLIIFSISIISNIFAQDNPDKYLPNGEPKFYYQGQELLTTDPSKPNNQFENKNFFDWTRKEFPVSGFDTTTKIMPSPYFENANGTPLDDELYKIIPKPIYPEDGWELVNFHLGYSYNNQGKLIFGAPDGELNIQLYNRYTGLLRIFFTHSYNNWFSDRIKFLRIFAEPFSNYEFSNVLEPNTEYNETKPLNSNYDISDGDYYPYYQYKVSKFYNEGFNWHYIDYHPNYDPCNCYLTDYRTITGDLIIQDAQDTSKLFIGSSINIVGFVAPFSKNLDTFNFGDYYVPYYNNPLGVFNILKQLQLDVYVNSHYTDAIQKDDESKYIRNSVAKLGGELEYVINQAAGFRAEQFGMDNSDVEILAAFQVDSIYKMSDIFITDNEELQYKRTKYMPIECLLKNSVAFENYETITPNDTNLLNNLPYIDRASLKLKIKLKRKDNNADVFYNVKYPLTLINHIQEIKSADINNLPKDYSFSEKSICEFERIKPILDAQYIYDYCHKSGASTYHFEERHGGWNGNGYLKPSNKSIALNSSPIYPNPASELINIPFESSSREMFTVTVNDLFGREIDKTEIYSFPGKNSLEYNCSRLLNGVYYLKVSNDKEYNKTYPISIIK